MSDLVKITFLSISLCVSISLFSAATEEVDKFLTITSDKIQHKVLFDEPLFGDSKSFRERLDESAQMQLPMVLGVIKCEIPDAAMPEFKFINVCSFLEMQRADFTPKDFENDVSTYSAIAEQLPSLMHRFAHTMPKCTKLHFGSVFISPNKRKMLASESMKDLLSLYLSFRLAGQNVLRTIAKGYLSLLVPLLQKLEQVNISIKEDPALYDIMVGLIIDKNLQTDTIDWLKSAVHHEKDRKILEQYSAILTSIKAFSGEA